MTESIESIRRRGFGVPSVWTSARGPLGIAEDDEMNVTTIYTKYKGPLTDDMPSGLRRAAKKLAYVIPKGARFDDLMDIPELKSKFYQYRGVPFRVLRTFDYVRYKMVTRLDCIYE